MKRSLHHRERVIVAATTLLAGQVLGDQLVYRQLVVPNLGTWSSVPPAMWLLVWAPVLAAGLAAGALLHTTRQVLVASVLGALASHGYRWFAAITHSPGHGKSFALEAPTFFWTLQLALVVLSFAGLLYLGRALARFLPTRHAA